MIKKLLTLSFIFAISIILVSCMPGAQRYGDDYYEEDYSNYEDEAYEEYNDDLHEQQMQDIERSKQQSLENDLYNNEALN